MGRENNSDNGDKMRLRLLLQTTGDDDAEQFRARNKNEFYGLVNSEHPWESFVA